MSLFIEKRASYVGAHTRAEVHRKKTANSGYLQVEGNGAARQSKGFLHSALTIICEKILKYQKIPSYKIWHP